jgi:hypothetical protein
MPADALFMPFCASSYRLELPLEPLEPLEPPEPLCPLWPL